MNDKERAAMQQALDAIGDCSPNKALVHAAYALREALEHSGEANEMVEFFSKEMKNKISVARAEQAEQEPIYISESCAERGCACHYSVEVDGEPVAVYSAPVRTKDLTDEEILFSLGVVDRFEYFEDDLKKCVEDARAVIAADRRKNK